MTEGMEDWGQTEDREIAVCSNAMGFVGSAGRSKGGNTFPLLTTPLSCAVTCICEIHIAEFTDIFLKNCIMIYFPQSKIWKKIQS